MLMASGIAQTMIKLSMTGAELECLSGAMVGAPEMIVNGVRVVFEPFSHLWSVTGIRSETHNWGQARQYTLRPVMYEQSSCGKAYHFCLRMDFKWPPKGRCNHIVLGGTSLEPSCIKKNAMEDNVQFMKRIQTDLTGLSGTPGTWQVRPVVTVPDTIVYDCCVCDDYLSVERLGAYQDDEARRLA